MWKYIYMRERTVSEKGGHKFEGEQGEVDERVWGEEREE